MGQKMDIQTWLNHQITGISSKDLCYLSSFAENTVLIDPKINQ